MKTNSRAYRDGQAFYLLAPGVDKKVAEKLRLENIDYAFASPEQIKGMYSKISSEIVELIIKDQQEFLAGLMDTMTNYPNNVPEELKKYVNEKLTAAQK